MKVKKESIKNLLNKYDTQWTKTLLTGVDTRSGILEVYTICSDKPAIKPREYGRVQEVTFTDKKGHLRYVCMFYRDPVKPTFWRRVIWFLKGTYFRRAPIECVKVDQNIGDTDKFIQHDLSVANEGGD